MGKKSKKPLIVSPFELITPISETYLHTQNTRQRNRRWNCSLKSRGNNGDMPQRMRHISPTGVNDELSRRKGRSVANADYTDLRLWVTIQKPIYGFALRTVTSASHARHLRKRKKTAVYSVTVTAGTWFWWLSSLSGYRARPFLGLRYNRILWTVCAMHGFLCNDPNVVVNRRSNRFGLARLCPKVATSTWT